ncbi:MAG: hypothetical protein ACO1SV_25265 [Fimbriimonas sp.]
MNRAQKIAVGVIVGVPIVCCLGGILTVQNVVGRAAGTLEGDLAELRRTGFPTEPADLNRPQPANPDANAAPLYVQATKLLREGSSADQAMRKVSQGLSAKAKPDQVREAEVAYSELSDLIDLAERAADRPECVFDRDWSKGYALEFREYRPLKDLAKLLAYKAERQSKAGDWRGALRSVRRSQQIAKHAKFEPTLISMLVSIANETIATRSFRKVIDRHADNPEFLKEARKVHADFGPLPSLRYALGSELVLGRIAIRNLQSVKDISELAQMASEEEASNRPEGRIPLSPFRGAFEARYVREFRLVEPSLSQDPEKWKEARAALLNLERRVDADKSPLGIMNKIILPVFNQASLAVGKTQAERRMTESALRLLQARQTRSLPKGLIGGPQLNADPFGTGPLRYVPAGRGFTLYSVGPDGVDDGGKPASNGSKTSDLVVKFR